MISKNSLTKSKKRNRPKFNIDVESLLWMPGNVAVFWKNIEGRYLGCNDLAAESVKLSSRHDILEKSNFDLNFVPAEAQMMQAGDIKVMQTAKPQQFYYTYTSSDKVSDLLSFKAPLYDENGEIAGIFGIDNFLAVEDLNRSIDVFRDAKLKADYIQTISKQHNAANLLTKRQLECLHLLVKGKTMKQIAAALNLSPKTIEHYLDAIKIKLNCQTRSELIEKGLKLFFSSKIS